MGLSNYIPSSRISQSGVCTSSTRPATPYEGQMIYETDTNRVLVYDASAWVMIADTDSPPGMQLVGVKTFTNESAPILSNVFTSEFQDYKIVIDAYSTDAANRYCHFRLTSGGTPATTGYYSKSVWWSMSTGGSTPSDADQRTDRFCLGPIGYTASQAMIATIDIGRPALAEHTTMTGSLSGAYYTVYFGMAICGGAHTTNSAYDGIQLFTTGGNVTGSIRVYGYRNS